MKVAVLGSGPAGLLAAQAALERHHEVDIIAPGVKSVIGGAQYLHSAIEGVTEDAEMEMVTYTKVGAREGYARKVYGSEDAPVSWDIFGIGEYPAWPMKAAYDRLWYRLLEEEAVEVAHIAANVSPAQVPYLCDKYDLVLSSVPAKALCVRPDHMFKSQPIRIASLPYVQVRNLIVYNGRDDDNWYRASNLFGHMSVEWSDATWEANPRMEYAPDQTHGHVSYPITKGIKPVHTNCDCHLHLGNYQRIGRFGRWTKGVLVSHAYRDAITGMIAHEGGEAAEAARRITAGRSANEMARGQGDPGDGSY